MDNKLMIYTDCCNKLEKIASKRRIYCSESAFKLNKKDSKLNVSTEHVFKDSKGENKKIPFICVKSPNKSYHMGINIQTALSMIKQFPGQSLDEQNYSTNSTINFLAETKSNKKSGSSILQQFSDTLTCPAKSIESFNVQEDETFHGVNPNPWAVKQVDRSIQVFECDHKKNSCSCPTRSMDNYSKIMAPFLEDIKRKKKSFELVLNPYTKEKVVQYYEYLSRHIQELKLNIIAMDDEFIKLTEKYNKLYEQHVRNPNGVIMPIMLQTEDELTALKTRIEETIDMYKEASYMSTQEQSDTSSSLLVNIKAHQNLKPKDTTTIRLAKVLRRVQSLQEKLKSGHLIQGSGDHVE